MTMRRIPITPSKLLGDVLHAARVQILTGAELAQWADALLTAGFDSDKIIETAVDPNIPWEKVQPSFVAVCRELGLSNDPYSEIETLMQEVMIEEYRQGHRQAAELLWRFDKLRKQIGFPQPIHFRLLEDNANDTNESGYYSDDKQLHHLKLEGVIHPYLERAGILRDSTE